MKTILLSCLVIPFIGGVFSIAAATQDSSQQLMVEGERRGTSGPDSRWSAQFGASDGCNGWVHALAIGANGEVYLGGEFTMCGGTPANRVVRYEPDTNSWSALINDGGNGVNDTVYALAVSGSDLYIGGSFSEANVGGAVVNARRIVRWSGTEWFVLGTELANGVSGGDNSVRALAVSGGDLYVGGGFIYANFGADQSSVVTNRIARWDGSAWWPMGSGTGRGVNATVYALAVSGNDLYVGGSFTQSNIGSGSSLTTSRVARWDGVAWSRMGGGTANTVRAIAVSINNIYVGGDFGSPANRVAQWDGIEWSALGSGDGNGVNNSVNALAVWDGDLYVGGSLSHANVGGTSIPTNRVARWNGTDWTSLASGVSGGSVFALAMADADTLYVGGSFTQAGNQPSSRIDRYATRGNLDVSLTGTGLGAVNSAPVGLECPGACSERFSWDQPVTLNALPQPGSAFVGWSGGGCAGIDSCVIDFHQDTSVSAQFDPLFSVGGSVIGLQHSGLVLQNNGGDDLAIEANGSFSFATGLPDGGSYQVAIASLPSSQNCAVDNGNGSIAAADVTDIIVTCSSPVYTVHSSVQAGNGSITPDTQHVGHGDSAGFTVIPDTGWRLAEVTGDTCSPVGDGGPTWTASGIVDDCEVHARFEVAFVLDVVGGNNQSTAVGADFAEPMLVQVTDPDGLPLMGVDVSFMAPTSGASAALSSTQVATNIHGMAWARATANLEMGSYTIAVNLSDQPDLLQGQIVLSNIQAQFDLSAHVDNGQDYSHYGQVLNYLVQVRNEGPDPAHDLDLTVLLSDGLDEAQATWLCLNSVGGSGCTLQGSGALAESGLTLAPNGTLIYLLSVPVRPDTDDAAVQAELQVIAGSVTESAIDLDLLVLLRDGFDGAGRHWLDRGIPTSEATRLDSDTVIEVSAEVSPSAGITTIWRGVLNDATTIALDRLHHAGQTWVRVRLNTQGANRLSPWQPWSNTTKATLWLVADVESANQLHWAVDGIEQSLPLTDAK